MTPDTQDFLLALSDRWLPFLFVLAGLVGTYLKLRSVERGIDGRMNQLIQMTGQAAHAEGKAEVLEQVADKAVAPPTVVVVPPDATPGGRRRTDPPAPLQPAPPVPPDPAGPAP